LKNAHVVHEVIRTDVIPHSSRNPPRVKNALISRRAMLVGLVVEAIQNEDAVVVRGEAINKSVDLPETSFLYGEPLFLVGGEGPPIHRYREIIRE
jgi:hypothetical protein